MGSLFVLARALVLAILLENPPEKDEPLRQIGAIPLPGLEGRLDHLAVDLKTQRLFVAALGTNSLEVIGLAEMKRLRSLSGVKEPQGVAFIPDPAELVVACGEDGKVKFFEGVSLRPQQALDFKNDADNVRYSEAARRLYVGFGHGALAVIDSKQHERLMEIPLPGHPESFQLEKEGKRIFVNVPSAHQVAVVDREKRAVVQSWQLEADANFPMALDEPRHRLFIGCRKPARLLVLDTETGKSVGSVEASGDTDDLFYDAALKRIYSSAGEGFLDVFQEEAADRYRRIARIPTARGARTSLFVPELKALYLAVPPRKGQASEVRVYQVVGPGTAPRKVK
jgi:DNA-binding beta-propeller fold protein YncE